VHTEAENAGTSGDDLDKGMGMLLYDGMCSQVLGVFTSGAFLVAFALLLGASNKVIGLLAAVGPFAQILQIPAIYLVNWTRKRKLLVVLTSVVGRLFWILVAALPWFAPAPARIPLLLFSMFAFFGLGAISSCAFNSWMRDFVPERRMGGFFAKRMALATALGAALSLVAGAGVDVFKRYFTEEIGAYSILFASGTFFGLLGLYFLSRVPEPRMAPQPAGNLLGTLIEPVRDREYRKLLIFLAAWSFAVNFAGPFFTVYMLQRLGLNMTWILALAVASQFVNVLFFRIWGKLADRFSNKSCIAVAGPLFIFTFLMWPFTTLPERYFLTVPLLIVIHVLAGVSTAGVGLCAGNLALKAAPYGRATAFLAVNALVSGMAATLAPIVAGFAADFFSQQELSLTIDWKSLADAGAQFTLPAVSLRGLDFVFVVAFVLGLYATHRLLAVKELGEVEEEVVLTELYAEVRRASRNVSNVAGIRHLFYFPFAVVRRAKSIVDRANNQGHDG